METEKMILFFKIVLVMVALAIIGFSIATYRANADKEKVMEAMRKFQH
jgi:hypothetical protein